MMRKLEARSLTRFVAVALVAIVLVALLAGCQRPEFLDEELPDDGAPIQTSPQAAMRFVEKMTAAGERAKETKSLSLSISQQEVTSFLDIGGIMAEQMEAMNLTNLSDVQQIDLAQGLEGVEGLEQWQALLDQRDGLPNISLSDLSLRVVIRDPQVYFKGNGQLIVRGYAEALGQRQPVRLVFAPKASQGELVLDFVEGNLGPVEVPELLIDQVGKGLARAIMAGQEFIEITDITVSEGTMTLAGRYVGP
jgi:hypothetical protein